MKMTTLESSIMVFVQRIEHGSRIGFGGKCCRSQCFYYKRMGHTQETCYSLYGFPNKTTHVSKSRKFDPRFSDKSIKIILG